MAMTFFDQAALRLQGDVLWIIAMMLSLLSPAGSDQRVLPNIWGNEDRSRPWSLLPTNGEPRGRKLVARVGS